MTVRKKNRLPPGRHNMENTDSRYAKRGGAGFRCRFFPAVVLFVLVSAVLPAQNAEKDTAENTDSLLFGVWENSARFLEFSLESGLRIVLKPYYAFVYEDAGWIPCSVSAVPSRGGIFLLSVSYPGERTPAGFPVAVIGGGDLFTRFYVRERPAGQPPAEPAALSGFWREYGNSGEIRLYSGPPPDAFFCLWFSGSRYCRIRYWLTGAPFREGDAVFTPQGETEPVAVPKFLRAGNAVYTCVTGTGSVLRNYEQGTWEIAGNEIRFQADRIVFAGARREETLPVFFSASGDILAFGPPAFTRSGIQDLDGEIAAHNAKRRPPREPPLEFMELDFRWEEIERIRR